MTHLRLYETPNLGVHQTGSSSSTSTIGTSSERAGSKNQPRARQVLPDAEKEHPDYFAENY
jgi:hypothetical protein